MDFAIFRKLLFLLYGLILSNSKKRGDEWSDSVKLPLLWAHIDKIFDLMIRVNAKEPKEHCRLLEYLNGTVDFNSQNLFDFDPLLDADCRHPRFLNQGVFYGLAAESFFKDVPWKIIKNIDVTRPLSELCFIRKETTLYPNQQFLIDHRRRSNITASFLSAENLETFF